MGSLVATSMPLFSFSFIPASSSAGYRGGRASSRARLRIGGPVAYMERSPNSLSGLANMLIGSLPIVGLLVRIANDEGGVGDDLINFAEFRRRVGKMCSITDSRAFIEFKDRLGRAGDPFYVLLCCWLAAIGAGLLKSEEILEGVARLRISNDIEFEEETFLAAMKSAKEKRAKLKAAIPEIPIEILVNKAFEAIYVCCFGKDAVEEEDVRLLCIMLGAVFPSVDRLVIERIVNYVANEIAEGNRPKFSEQKPLPKEAVERRQMKDLRFLRLGSEESS